MTLVPSATMHSASKRLVPGIAAARRAHQRVGRSGAAVADGDGVDFAKTLRSARRGDGVAFATLHQMLAGRVLAFARARSTDDPEGLTNEVFLAAFKRLDTFKGSEGAFVGWVFQIARNKVIDEHRRMVRRPNLAAEPARQTPVQISAEDQYLNAVSTPAIRVALAQLSEGQRDVILMRVVAGLSFREVAAAIGKRTGATKEQYRRGIAALQRAMEVQPCTARVDLAS